MEENTREDMWAGAGGRAPGGMAFAGVLCGVAADPERKTAPWEVTDAFTGGGMGVLETGLGTIQRMSEVLLALRTGLTAAEGRLSLMNARLGEIQEGLGRVESRLDSLCAEDSQMGSHLTQIRHSQEAHGNNLEQVRLACEALSRRMDDLAGDFIQRQVSDPLFREILRTYGELRCLERSQKSDVMEEVKGVGGQLAHFLDSQGLTIINPPRGAQFDPRAHHAIERCETGVGAMHGRVACTHHLGLAQDGRIIQPARVAVFVFVQETGEKTNSKKGGVYHENPSEE